MTSSEQITLFPAGLQKCIGEFSPTEYSRSRNYTHGSVSELGPYFTHGVLNAREFADYLVVEHGVKACGGIISQLAWREFFRTVWWDRGDLILTDLRSEQYPVECEGIPAFIYSALTGIDVIDDAIIRLYTDGKMHNHERLWLASLTCNLVKSHWLEPSRWLYYHLLDGDVASNSLSWQWVAGSFSHKKYLCNQENVNKFSGLNQAGTLWDVEYDDLTNLSISDKLRNVAQVQLVDQIPEHLKQRDLKKFEASGEIALFSLWSLGESWCRDLEAKRILLIEPSVLEKFPMSKKRWQFIHQQIEQLGDIEIYYGEFAELEKLLDGEPTYLNHPMVRHWKGKGRSDKRLFPMANGYFPSFSKFWKRVQHEVKHLGYDPYSYT